MIKKSLGQNFFINENLGKQIIQYIEKDTPDIIVEIGPGRGFFTKKLCTLSSNVLAIEKDDELARSIHDEYPTITVLNQDFLDWKMSELEQFKDRKITFFGSLPYNVSKPIIQKIISSKFFNSPSYFIIQKEVAEKYTAKAPDNNILSLRTQLYANVKKILDISPGSFLPSPKVTSSYVVFSSLNRTYTFDIQKFFSFVEQSFKSPRKTLKNNLRGRDIGESYQTILTKRPSELTLEQYIDIFTNLS